MGNKTQRIPPLGALKYLKYLFIQRNRLDHIANLKNIDGIDIYIGENPVAKEINEKFGVKVNFDGELIWSEKLRREIYK